MQAQPPHAQGQGMAMAQSAMPQNDMQWDIGNSGTGDGNAHFNLDFSTLENADVLENFDFDSFLNTSAEDTMGNDFSNDFGADFSMGQID